MKMEIELTEEQAKKVEILKENNIEVGDAIEMLFDMRQELSEQGAFIVEHRMNNATQLKAELEEKLSQVENEISLYTKLKDASIDSTQKQKMIEKEYGIIRKTYDESVQDQKHKFKWTDSFFKL